MTFTTINDTINNLQIVKVYSICSSIHSVPAVLPYTDYDGIMELNYIQCILGYLNPFGLEVVRISEYSSDNWNYPKWMHWSISTTPLQPFSTFIAITLACKHEYCLWRKLLICRWLKSHYDKIMATSLYYNEFMNKLQAFVFIIG